MPVYWWNLNILLMKPYTGFPDNRRGDYQVVRQCCYGCGFRRFYTTDIVVDLGLPRQRCIADSVRYGKRKGDDSDVIYTYMENS